MSRLIDADAEIAKIEEEIQRSRKAIERWQSRQLEGNSLYDIDAKIRRLQNNITDCRREIRILRSYETAYDVDKVVEQIEALKEKEICEDVDCYYDCKYLGICFDGEMGYKIALDKAIKIAKGGETNAET